MLQVSEHSFFFAEQGGKPVGVFSSDEKVASVTYDSLTEIKPFLLESSPVCDGYICMAKGTCVMLLRRGDSFETAYFDLGPAWGLNPQSAVGGMCGVHHSRKNVFTTELYLFEIDRTYAEGELENFDKHPMFSDLTQRACDHDSLTQEQIKTDYIARWIDRQNREALYAQRASSAEVQMLSDRLTQAACAANKGQSNVSRCGFALSRIYSRTHESIKHRLLHEFEQQELRELAVLLLLMEPSEEVPIPQGEAAAQLLERVKDCVPIPPARRRRRLKDCLD